MRPLTYYIAATLDGFIAGPQGEFDFFGFEGDIVQEILTEYPETIPVHGRGPLGLDGVPNKRFDTVLMGRASYEPGLSLGISSPYPHLEQYVFSRSLASQDPRVNIVSGDAAAFVRGLKQQEGQGIWLCGGGKLAAQLLPEIDELIIKRNPVVLGAGIPLFDGPFAPTSFTLTESRTFDTGVAVQTYTRSAVA
ncbi:dihydrofolate reductase family protein [Streptomyces sp. NPDC048111]|uniref:dihydrofolate reductase family protein n=1 Tax=Streptomyces sp. NPDC048111 TaxID=3365500 RepID=UPI0037162441